MRYLLCVVLTVIGLGVLAASPASAQATRTWVSGVGDDANPCSRTAPCKTFAGAISKTAAAGEIDALDAAGFGGVTITKAITIRAIGVEGGVLVSGTNGITVNAGPNDQVILSGLQFEGLGTSPAGVKITSAGNVLVENSSIHGFTSGSGYGVDIESPNPVRVYLRNDLINGNGTGLYVHGNGTGLNAVFVDSCVFDNNTVNTMNLDTSLSAVRIFGNRLLFTPVALSNGATLTSFGNNFIAGTVGPTSTISLQ